MTTNPTDTAAAVAALLGRAGHDITLAGVTLGLVVGGTLVQAGAVRDLSDPLATVRLALLAGVLAALARSASLLIAAHRRLLGPLSRLRCLTGAHGQTPWTAPAPPSRPMEIAQEIRYLISDAHDRQLFAHGALLWAITSAGTFAVWTLANALSGAGT